MDQIQTLTTILSWLIGLGIVGFFFQLGVTYQIISRLRTDVQDLTSTIKDEHQLRSAQIQKLNVDFGVLQTEFKLLKKEFELNSSNENTKYTELVARIESIEKAIEAIETVFKGA